MQESTRGKDAARKMLFLEVLPTWLTELQVRSGNYLLLIGKEPHELKLTDQQRIPRHNVWSVENDLDIFFPLASKFYTYRCIFLIRPYAMVDY